MLHRLMSTMIEYFADRRYVEHAMKVYAYARAIGGEEGLAPDDLSALEAAAVVHDVGIPVALRIYGSGAGPYQEKEGERLVPGMMRGAGYGEEAARRVARLVGRHHSPEYVGEDGLLQYLLEADDLVNLSEGKASADKIADSRANLFKTATGLRYLDILFPSDEG